MARRVHYGGLVVAGIGFFLTRFTVTLALYEDPIRFYLAGVVPLMLGLGLASFGIALAVADVDASLVRTTALWCVAGSGAMLVLVVLTLVGSSGGLELSFATVRSQTYLSNFLIGGSVGGTLTGVYASRNRQQRAELQRQARRLEVLNRLLRHEVLNAVNVIQGYASMGGDVPDAPEIIREHSSAIERTVEEVRYLTRTTGSDHPSDVVVDLGTQLEASVRDVTERHPDATVSLEALPGDVTVYANERLNQVFAHLFVDEIVRATDAAPSIDVTVTATSDAVRVSVRGGAASLPEEKRALLEDGEIGTFDDRGTGFRLNVARLLVESYGGTIETDAGDGAATVTVVLRRVSTVPDDPVPGVAPSGDERVRPSLPHLVVTLVTALIAGVFYGVVSEFLGGSIAGIGVFYGTASPVVGWITHEFHSVVFAFVFAGLVSLAPSSYRDSVPAYVAIGLGWALVLWLVAAGVVAPVWLQLLGFDAAIPNLSIPLLVSHLAWGASLGVLTGWGYTDLAPRVARVTGGA